MPTLRGRIASAIRSRRELLQLHQLEVSVSCGWSQQKLSRIERGAQAITIEEAHTLAAALGMEVGAIILPCNPAGILCPGDLEAEIRAWGGMQRILEAAKDNTAREGAAFARGIEHGKRIALDAIQRAA